MVCTTQILRRYLLILAFALWLGGFTFYASFVIPAAHDVIGDEFQNGLVTLSVNYIQARRPQGRRRVIPIPATAR